MPIFPCDAVLKSLRIIIILTRELRFILLLPVLFLIIFLVYSPVFIPHLLHLIHTISIIPFKHVLVATECILKPLSKSIFLYAQNISR